MRKALRAQGVQKAAHPLGESPRRRGPLNAAMNCEELLTMKLQALVNNSQVKYLLLLRSCTAGACIHGRGSVRHLAQGKRPPSLV